jgi:hypothetical protein
VRDKHQQPFRYPFFEALKCYVPTVISREGAETAHQEPKSAREQSKSPFFGTAWRYIWLDASGIFRRDRPNSDTPDAWLYTNFAGSARIRIK